MIIDFLLDDIREAIADIQEDVSGLTETSFADVDYVASAKTIYFYNVLGEELGTIDTTDFVIDGMVDNVTLSGSILSITFNTDAGKETINIDLNDFINPEYYWTSAQTKDYVDSGDTATYAAASAYTDEKIAEVYASGTSYTDGRIEEVYASGVSYTNDKIDEVYASSSTYADEAIAEALAPYWDSAATKDYVDAAVSGIDLSNYYTKAETDSAITAVENHIYDVEEVTASAYTELHDDILELSARTVDLSGYYTSAQTDNKIAQVIAAYTPTSGFSTINGSAITNGGNIVIQGGGGGDLSNYWTSAETKTYVDSADTALQDQIDTMDDVVSAALVNLNDTKVGSADVKTIVKLTQAEYEALTVKDPYTFYIIIDNS